MPKGRLPSGQKTSAHSKTLTERQVLDLPSPRHIVGTNQVAPLQYRLDDAARLLAISKRSLERWIQQGRVSSTGRGRFRRVEFAEILRVLDQLRGESEAA